MNPYFIQGLLDTALREKAVLGKTVNRQCHELEQLQRDYNKLHYDYNKLHRLSIELNTLYDNIPDWIKQLSTWWRKKHESTNI
jgi:hypothetical protein